MNTLIDARLMECHGKGQKYFNGPSSLLSIAIHMESPLFEPFRVISIRSTIFSVDQSTYTWTAHALWG